MNIKVYSPIDGTIGKIEELADGIFSEKMLGDGFFVRPLDQTKIISFFSPIETGKVQFVADTKHAVFFDLGKETNVLMHIGLDTVKLDGKPFSNMIEINKDVNLKTKIVDVDTKLIQNSGLDSVCPVTINSENEKYEFKLTIDKEIVKTGELVGEFVLVDKNNVQEKKIDVNNEESLRSFFSNEDVYSRLAKRFNKLVGTKANYDDVYNCMTRLRFKIRDRNLVQMADIKKIEEVKGIVWNGNELQIIIGQDVYKYKEAVLDFLKKESAGDFNLQAKANLKNASIGSKIIQVFSGIMVPCIPVFIGAGLVSAITGILSLVHLFPNTMSWQNMNQTIANQPWYWVFLYAIGKTEGMFIGVIVAVSATKYFGLRLPMGVAIAISMCSCSLFLDGTQTGMGPQWKIWTIHHYSTQDIMSDAKNYALDKILNPGIECCEFKIFVLIMTIYFAKRLDDYLLKIISPVFELTVRSFLTFFISCTVGMLIFLPIWDVFEGILTYIFIYVSKCPLGIGVAAYTALWQMAVTVGMHMSLGMIAGLQSLSTINEGGYGMFGASSSISVYCMLGSMIGLMLVTKNSALKTQCKGLILCPILGITEPIIYGIAVPRKKTYWSAIGGAFIAGLFLGNLNVTGRIGTGIGIFEAIGFFNYTQMDPNGDKARRFGELSALDNGLYYLLAIAVAIAASFILSFLFSEYRKQEKASVKRTSLSLKKAIAYSLLLNNMSKSQMKNVMKESNINFKDIANILNKEDIKKIKDVEKDVILLNKFKTQLAEIIRKETKLKDHLGKKGAKLIAEEKIDQAKILVDKIYAINNEEKKEQIREKIKKIKPKFEIIDEIIKEKINKIKNIIDKQKNITNIEMLSNEKILNSFYNALNEMRIEYRESDSKDEYEFGSFILKSKIELKKQFKEAKK